MFLFVMLAPTAGALTARFIGQESSSGASCRGGFWRAGPRGCIVCRLLGRNAGGGGPPRLLDVVQGSSRRTRRDVRRVSECRRRGDRLARLPLALGAAAHVVSALVARRRRHLVAVSPSAHSPRLVRDSSPVFWHSRSRSSGSRCSSVCSRIGLCRFGPASWRMVPGTRWSPQDSRPRRVSGSAPAAFVGSVTWVGEFGWLAALSMLILGAAAAAWHVGRPVVGRTDSLH